MIHKEISKRLLEKPDAFPSILGQSDTKRALSSALLSGRHAVIMGPPGIGKTTLARDVSKLLPDIDVVSQCVYNCLPNDPSCPSCQNSKDKKTRKLSGENRFVRIQGSPDLTVEDLLGDIDPIKAMKFGPLSMEAFTPGKVFKANNGILFFDELNRCPEKLQNALLQVLEEGKATIGSYDVDITTNFIFIGTMNPQDSSTEKLSDVFLDRFDIIYMEYPEKHDIEKEIVDKKSRPLGVSFPEDLKDLAIHFVRALRIDKNISKKPSVRASIGIIERAGALALLSGRKEVAIEDIRESIISVLAHRIELKPSVKYLKSTFDYVQEEYKKLEQKFEGLNHKESDSL